MVVWYSATIQENKKDSNRGKGVLIPDIIAEPRNELLIVECAAPYKASDEKVCYFGFFVCALILRYQYFYWVVIFPTHNLHLTSESIDDKKDSIMTNSEIVPGFDDMIGDGKKTKADSIEGGS